MEDVVRSVTDQAITVYHWWQQFNSDYGVTIKIASFGGTITLIVRVVRGIIKQVANSVEDMDKILTFLAKWKIIKIKKDEDIKGSVK